VLRGAALIAVAVLALSPVATQAASTAPVTTGCTIKLFFRLNATQVQMAEVKHRLSRDREVASFRFVSRAGSLEELRKKYPDLVKNLTGHPLPARIDIRLKSGVDQGRFIARYASMKVPGLQSVKNLTVDGLAC
jgi:cell division protein FtsX